MLEVQANAFFDCDFLWTIEIVSGGIHNLLRGHFLLHLDRRRSEVFFLFLYLCLLFFFCVLFEIFLFFIFFVFVYNSIFQVLSSLPFQFFLEQRKLKLFSSPISQFPEHSLNYFILRSISLEILPLLWFKVIQGFEPIFHHVFSSFPSQLFWDLCPFFAQLYYSWDQFIILWDAPRTSHRNGVKMIDPVFSTLFSCFEKLLIRSDEEIPSNFIPLVLNALGLDDGV